MNAEDEELDAVRTLGCSVTCRSVAEVVSQPLGDEELEAAQPVSNTVQA